MTLVKYYLLFNPGMFPFTSLIRLPTKTLNKLKLYHGKKTLSHLNFLIKTMFTPRIETEFPTRVFKIPDIVIKL